MLTCSGLPAPAPAQQARPGFVPPLESPAVSTDRDVTFRIRAAQAESVRLVGNDMPEIGQGLSMTRGDNGIWETTVGPVQPGAYRYRFELDGVAVNDPANSSSSESNGNSWSLVHAPGADWMDTRQVPHGAIAEVTYHSSSLGRFRRMHVYTPPGYGLDAQVRYPVFYLLHGAFDCDDSWTTVGRAGFILDNLIADGHAAPMIVVMPAGHTGPFAMGRSPLPIDEFTQDFETDIVPYIEANYRVKEGRAHRAVAGLSMGGAQTLNIAIRHLDQYAYVGVFSSGVFGIGGNTPGRGPGDTNTPSWEEQHRDALADAGLKDGLALVWFATGKDDFLIETSRATVAMLKTHGFDVTFQETAGGHTWTNWREYLREFSQALFREDATPAPETTTDITGIWSTAFDTQIGLQQYVFQLTSSTTGVSGTADAEIGGETYRSEIVDGEVVGDTVRFVEQLDFQGMPLRIEYTGTLSGDEMRLNRAVGDVATESLVAQRQAAIPATNR
jgi:enterochelin esterase family protein